MSKCSPKVIQKFVCRGGRAKKYFVYFKTDNKDKRIFCLLLVHLLVLLVACGATCRSLRASHSFAGWRRNFREIISMLRQKNNTVHFSLPQTTWFDSPPSTVAHRHRAEVGACLCDSFDVGGTCRSLRASHLLAGYRRNFRQSISAVGAKKYTVHFSLPQTTWFDSPSSRQNKLRYTSLAI